MPFEDISLQDLMSLARDYGDAPERASMIVQICKVFDLTSPDNRFAVQDIAEWIDSPDSDVRREVVFALCMFKPVPGCERLLAPGWSRAPADDLHWYVSAIENSCSRTDQIPPELICAVASTLLTAPPPEPEDPRRLETLEAWQDYRWATEESARAMRHLVSVALPGQVWTTDSEIDWECVARLLHWSCCRSNPA